MASDGDEEQTDRIDQTDDETSIHRCDYCRLPIPHEPRSSTIDGNRYEFCSEACMEAVETSDRVYTKYHGFRRCRPGVAALKAGLPEGLPRNSFVMLTDLAGTRTEALKAELVWRALQRGEPVVYLSFLEPPVSVVQTFLDLEWNVIPYLEDDQFRILDGFSYRVADRDRMYDRMSGWNSHLWDVARDATKTVRDPTEIGELENRMDNALEAKEMHEDGIAVIDSLTELGTLVQPVQAYNFIKDIRADVCKGRFVPIFAGATITGEGEGFPHDLGYMVDGIVEMRLNEEIVEGALIKQIRVRKMNGVLTYPEWTAYEYTSGQGIVMFDPLEEMKKSRGSVDEASSEDAESMEGVGEDETIAGEQDTP